MISRFVYLIVLGLVFSLLSCKKEKVLSTPEAVSISIVSMDFPVIGDIIERRVDTMPTYAIGGDGEKVIWDFTNLAEGLPITNEILDPASTPYATAYATANVVVAGGSGFTFYHLSDSEMNSIGFIGNVPIVATQDTLIASNPVLNYEFPILYANTSQSSYFLLINLDTMPSMLPPDYIDLRVKTNVMVTDTIDAWGIVRMPLGDYQSLRNKRTETFSNEIQAYSKSQQKWVMLQNQAAQTSTSYRWLTKETKLPLIEYIFESGNVPALFIWNLIPPR